MLVAREEEKAIFSNRIEGYELQEKIGEGGMATVYKGLQTSLQRPVAIKFLQQNMADQASVREYFDQESLIVAQLNHPNIIHIIDRGISSDGLPYFVMEFIKGECLSKAIHEKPLTLNQKLDLVIQIGKALSYAHKHGIIHRDIKPANMLIDDEGIVHVLDFGIAQLEEQLDQQEEYIMGTMPYMAPEQRNLNGNITARSDIYAYGVLMYELFTGQQPAENPAPARGLNPEIPARLEQLINDCMAEEIDARPASAATITDELLKLLQGAHLHSDQRQRASMGTSKIEEKFALLDVIKESKSSAVYLYENRQDQNLMIVKKQLGDDKGYEEAQKLTNLNHPNINKVLGTSQKGPLFIIPMEYQGAGNLQERLHQGLPLREAVRITRDICRGLAFTHNREIFHSNLRPSNILFSTNGQVKISDFGLRDGDEAERKHYYFKSIPASAQTDIFAVGVMFYQMLTGELPLWHGSRLFRGDTFDRIPTTLQNLIGYMLSERCGPAKGKMEDIAAQLDSFFEELEKTQMNQAQTEEQSTATDDSNPMAVLGWLMLLLLLGGGLTLTILAFMR